MNISTRACVLAVFTTWKPSPSSQRYCNKLLVNERCLCRKSLDDATQRKKLKKLCDTNTRHIFEALLSSCNVTLGSYVETRSPDAYLRYTCNGKADKLHKRETEVEKLKRELMQTTILPHIPTILNHRYITIVSK